MKTIRTFLAVFSVFISSIIAVTSQAAVLHGPVTNPANGHKYYLYVTEHTTTDHTDWDDAESVAVSLGGHLVTINDAAEQAFVFDNFGTFGGVDRSLWIGLRKVGADFAWVSGEAVTYTNWHPGLPDNLGGSENYAHMFPSNNTYNGTPGAWNDAPNPTTPASAIIEPIGAVFEIVPHVTGKIVYQQFTTAFANNGSPADPGVELVLMDADGANKVVIAGPEFFRYGYAALTADGARVAFVAEKGLGGPKLWVMNAAPVDPVTNPAVMLRTSVSSLSRICWSPEGRRIAFQDNTDSQIYVLNAVDSSGNATPETAQNLAVKVTTGAFFAANGAATQAQNPAWSPDGKFLAYSNSTTIYALGILNSATLTPEAVGTNEPVPVTTNLFLGEDFPAWSPDATRIIFSSQPETPPSVSVKSDVAVRTVRQALAGGGALIPALQNGMDDGRVSLFRDQSGGFNPVYVHEAPNFVSEPSWSTDGTRVTYCYRFAGVPELDTVFSLKPEFEDAVTNPSTPIAEVTNFGDGTPGGRRASFQPAAIIALPALSTPTFDEIVGADFGDVWSFSATLASNEAGLSLRVQSSLTPGIEGSWADLADGVMARSGDTWSVETDVIPLGVRFFRVVASAGGFTSSKAVYAGQGGNPVSFNVASPSGPILFSQGALVGTRNLVLMQPDGTGKTVLTNATRSIQRSALSPDGTKIAFTTFSGDLFVMNAELEDSGTNPAIDVLDLSGVVANEYSAPAWSPDGQRLVFAANDTHLYVIEAIDENGEIQPYDVATNPLVDVGLSFSGEPNPAWSPDGRHLALVGGNYVEVFQIADANGALTPQSGTNFTIPLTHQSDFASAKIFASWSPDGTQIAFVERSVADSTKSRVSLLNARMADGTLTPESAVGGANERTTLHAFTSTPQVETVSWSPDGALLALGVNEVGQYRIETIAPAAIDTTNPRVPLTTFAVDGHSFQPSFKQSYIPPVPMQLVAFESPNYAGNEAGAPVVLKVLRTGGSEGELTVDFTVTGGTAVVEADFTISEGPLVFADGETEKTITITPINDGESGEGDETITLELVAPDTGDLGAIATATITLHDNETALDPFVGPAEEFTVAINGKVKKKGKGKTSDLWSFKVRQVEDSQLAALGVKIQTTATPADSASWVDLPEGALHRANATSFTWVGSNRRVPIGKVYFRTLSIADMHRPNAGPVAGPFTIVPAAVLDMSVRVVTDSDTSGASVKPGEFITYTLKLKNSGTALAKKVVMNSRLPQKTRFDSASNAVDGGTFHQDLDRKGVITDVFWTVGDLAPGATVTEFVTVQVDQTLPFEWIIQNDRLTNKAAGFKEAFLPIFRTDVTAPIRITAAKDKSIVVAGDLITYTLTITNDASLTVTGGKVTDQIPTGTRLVSYADGSGTGNYLGVNLNASSLSSTPNALSQPGFTPHNGMLSWNVGDIEAGGSRQLRFTVRVAYDLFEKIARNGESFNVQIQNLNFDFLATPPSGGVLAARGGVIPASEIARTFISAEPPTSRPELGLKKEAMSDTWTKLGDKDLSAVFDDGSREIEYEISAWNYGTIAANEIVITDGIPFETELFLDNPLVYNSDAFMARFVLNGTPVSSSAGFHFFDADGNPLTAGGEFFQDRNGNGKIDKGEYIDQNSNNKYDGPGAIRRFTYDYGALPPMTKPQEKTLTYCVRLTPKVKRGEYITAFNSARAPRGDGLQLTCPDFLYPLIGFPNELQTLVVQRVVHVVDQPVASISEIIADDLATHTVNYTLRFTNTGDFIATDTKLRVPLPGGFTTTSTTVERRNAKLDIPALPNSLGTAFFDIGAVEPGQIVTRQLALTLVTPVPPALFGKNGQLKLQSVPVFPLAYSTLAAAPSAARTARIGAAAETLTFKLPAAGSNGVATPFRLNKTGARVFIGRIAPASVQAGTEMDMFIFCGNHGDTDANDGEIAIQIPYGTRFVEALHYGFRDNGTNGHYLTAETTKSKSRRQQDGPDQTVYWSIDRLAAHGTTAVKLRLEVTSDFDGSAFTEKSCTVKFSDASGRTAAPLTVHVRHNTNGEVDAWQAIGNFMTGFGEVLNQALRSLFGDHSKAITIDSHVVSLAGTDYVQLTTGAVVIPLGGGRSAVIHRFSQLYRKVPFTSFQFTGNPDRDKSLAMAVGTTASQTVFVPGSINADRTIHSILGQLTDPVAGIVAAGGGNIVAAGGGNVVANDGAGIVAGGGLNFGDPGYVAKVVANDGAGFTLGTITFTALTRPGIVAAGGGNIVAAGGGNIVAAGGGNIVAAGGGNIVAGGGGNLVAFEGKLILADQLTSILTKLPDFEGATLNDIKIRNRDGLPGDSPILFNAAPLIGHDGSGLVGQDGASFR